MFTPRDRLLGIRNIHFGERILFRKNQFTKEIIMAKDIKVYDLLISCPSDVSEYVEMLEKEVNHFNNFFGRKNNIIVRTSVLTY